MADKKIDDILTHFGIKGMHWGVHKESGRSNIHRTLKTRKDFEEVQNLRVQNRKATKSDSEEIISLLNGLSTQDKKFLALEQKFPTIKHNIRSGKHGLVATSNGKIVGYLRDSGRPNGFVLIEELVVDPNYRGKGVASKMLNEFHSQNSKTLAKTKVNNQIMNSLLKAKGYKADNPNSKTVINWIRDDVKTMKEQKMVRKILDNMLSEEIQHGGDQMADKSVTIKNATDKQLDELIMRLRKERELQNLISDLKRNSSSGYMPYDYGQEISTEQAVELLYHFGIPGMKWGKRNRSSNVPSSEDHINKTKLQKKPLKSMSNMELRKLNERLQLEKQYKDLNPKDINKGLNFVKKVTAAGTTLASLYALSKTPMVQDMIKAIKTVK